MDISNLNEKYFRPSPYQSLNSRNFDYTFFDKYANADYSKISLPSSLLSSPYDTIINYFSILRESSSISSGGCGSIGLAKSAYPFAYNFFTDEYKGKVSFDKYVSSFKDIGHINLVKLYDVNPTKSPNEPYKYFFEIETIEPSVNGNTSFAYYYGFIYIENKNGSYKISDIDIRGEDFLCAPYHGWAHDAESYVNITYGDWCHLIKKIHEIKQDKYVKDIEVDGTDGREYSFRFLTLTNGTDIEIGQFVKENGTLKPIKIDVYKCINRYIGNCPYYTPFN